MKSWRGIHGIRLVFAAVALIPLTVATQVRAADYTVSGMSTRLKAPRDLQMENIQILNETTLSDGRVLFEVSADLRSLDDALWEAASARIEDAADRAWQFLGSTVVAIDQLGAGEVFDTGTKGMSIIVSAADRAAAEADILAGTLFQTTANLPDGTEVVNPLEIVLTPRIEDVIEMADGRFLINIGCAVAVGFDEFVTNFTMHLVEGVALWAFEEHSDLVRWALPPEAYGVTQPTQYMQVLTEASEVADARAEILNGNALEVVSSELWVYNAQPRGIDEETADNYQSGSNTMLTFSESTAYLDSLQSGDLILCDPGIHETESTAPSGEPTVIANYFPFEVTSISRVGDQVTVHGQRRELLEVLKSATFIQDASNAYDFPVREPYDPSLENTYTDSEMDDREDTAKIIADGNPRDGRLADLRGMNAIPWHFNDKFITDRLKVSGEVLLRSSGLKLEFKIRDFQLERAIAHLDAGVVVNLVAETIDLDDERENLHLNIIEELIDAAKLKERIPPVPLNIGGVPVTLQPIMYFNVGADANIPQDITLPIQSSFNIGLDMGWERDRLEQTGNGFFYEFSDEFIPVRISEPTIFDDLVATMGFWAEFGVGMEGTIAATLDVSPTLALRLQNDFEVAPFDDPWWSIHAHGELQGRFAIDFLGLNAVDAEATLLPFDLYRVDAGGPLLPTPQLSGTRPRVQSEDSLSAMDVRWASAYQASETAGEISGLWCLPELDDEVLVVMNQTTASSIVKYSYADRGNLLWAKEFQSGAKPNAATIALDETVLLAGYRNSDLWIGAYDGDANEQWLETYDPNKSLTIEALIAEDIDVAPPVSPVIASVEPRSNHGTGDHGHSITNIFLAGHLHHGNIRTSDPAVVRFDGSGQVEWSKYYASEGDDEAYDILQTIDGNLVLCGTTEADVANPPLGIPDSGNALKNATDNGLLMKIDPDGNVLWARSYASRHAMTFRSVTELDGGNLVVVGDVARPVNIDYPVILVAKFDADGNLLDHVTVGEDPDWDDELPTGGNTAWDRGSRIIHTDEGLWLCGSTGLGDESSGWVISMTEELGVRMFGCLDGKGTDVATEIVDTGHGILVGGGTQSLLPWGNPSSHSALVMHLPFEAKMAFHEDLQFEMFYLQPQVFHSSADLDFTLISQIPSLPPQTFTNPSSDVDLQAMDFNLQPTAASIELADAVDPVERSVEKVERGQIQTPQDWADYHQLGSYTPGDDSDGDGVSDVFEAYFGRNPWIPESAPLFEIEPSGSGEVLVQYVRSADAASFNVIFEQIAEFAPGSIWGTLVNASETVESLPTGNERVTITVPRDTAKKFIRAAALTASP